MASYVCDNVDLNDLSHYVWVYLFAIKSKLADSNFNTKSLLRTVLPVVIALRHSSSRSVENNKESFLHRDASGESSPNGLKRLRGLMTLLRHLDPRERDLSVARSSWNAPLSVRLRVWKLFARACSSCLATFQLLAK